MVEFVNEMCGQGFPVARETIQLKAQEITKIKKIPESDFKASYGWCRRMMVRNGLCPHRHTTLAQKFSIDFEEEQVTFLCDTQKKNDAKGKATTRNYSQGTGERMDG